MFIGACGPFTRHKERIKKFKQTGDTRYIYRNELDKTCFQHDSTYADHKDLINRTEADTIKYVTRVLKPNLCDYAEAYILVDCTIRATNAVNATKQH